MKKLASLAAAGALLLGMAAPVFGCWWCGGGDDVTINNHAWVSSRVKTRANTGRNSTTFCGSIGTGAANASSIVTNLVNTSIVNGL